MSAVLPTPREQFSKRQRVRQARAAAVEHDDIFQRRKLPFEIEQSTNSGFILRKDSAATRMA